MLNGAQSLGTGIPVPIEGNLTPSAKRNKDGRQSYGAVERRQQPGIGLRTLHRQLAPQTEHVRDWFHVSMKFQGLKQIAISTAGESPAASQRQAVIAGRWLLAARAAGADALMCRHPDLDLLPVARTDAQAHVLINKTDKGLYPIQDGLNLKLNRRSLLFRLSLSLQKAD